MKRIAPVLVWLCLLGTIASAEIIFYEDFAGGLPGSWTVVDNLGGTGGIWVDDNPGQRDPEFNLTEPFMIADSDEIASKIFNTDLISPSIDCSTSVQTTLAFGSHFQTVSGIDKGLVSVSGNGGATWTDVLLLEEDGLDQLIYLDISAIADSKPNVKLKFNYNTYGDTYLWFWAVDNITVDGKSVDLYLSPSISRASAGAGLVAGHELTILNNTGAGGTVSIDYAGGEWELSGPTTLEVANGESKKVSVLVTTPVGGHPGAADQVTLTASIGSYGAEATLVTIVGWGLLPDVSHPRGDAAMVMADKKLYLLGGTLDGNAPVNQVDVFDVLQGAWSGAADIGTPLSIIDAAVIGGVIYVPGGYTGSSFSLTTLTYDIAADLWGTTADVPVANAAYVAVTDGTDLYRIGGGSPADFEIPFNGFYKYTVAGKQWTQLADLPVGRKWPMAGVIDGKIYIAGGQDDFGDSLTMNVYDIAGETWETTKAVLPDTWWGGAGVVVDDSLWVFGGIKGGKAACDAYYYDPVSDTWNEAPSMNDCRFRLGGAGDDEGLFAAAGWEPVFAAHPSFEYLTFLEGDDDDDDDDDNTDSGDDDDDNDDDDGDDGCCGS